MTIILLILLIALTIALISKQKNIANLTKANNELTASLDKTSIEQANLTASLEEANRTINDLHISQTNLKTLLERANKKIDALSAYQPILDIDIEINRKRQESSRIINEAHEQAQEHLVHAQNEASQIVATTKQEAESLIANAKIEAREIREKIKAKEEAANENITQKISYTTKEAERIIEDAKQKASEIAGSALEIKENADKYTQIATAMKNTIDGYGLEYLKPTYSFLDELADSLTYTEAGRNLKLARVNTIRMATKDNTATICDYAQPYRRDTARAFVLDAFNGKVDSILSKTKQDNYGILEQKIKDAYTLVNYSGSAFRNAAITPEYLDARLQELKWAVAAKEIKAREQEEQRQIREQMREEQKAQREYERAIKEAAKEEEMLKKAMEKAQQQIASASEAKRAEYEAKLLDLQQKLTEAEARGQRAISMAQQTKRGNVYVISNIGAFGENIYKVGMTRRWDPMERIRELSDASVPFSFDVHAIIKSDDAPALENELHHALALTQVNKVNPRKEFFRVPLSTIKAIVEAKGIDTQWTLKAEAAEYYETLSIEEQIKNDPKANEQWKKHLENYINNLLENSQTDEEQAS